MVLRWGMANEIEAGPDCLEQDLTSAIREALPLIRQLAGKPKHVPGDEQYGAIREAPGRAPQARWH